MTDVGRRALAAGRILPGDAAKLAVAFERHDLRARPERDVRRFLDAADEVARHALGEARASHEHLNVSPSARQEDGGLARGVPPSDDDDVVAVAEVRLDLGRAVVDPDTLEPGQVRQVGLPVSGARGYDGRARAHGGAGSQIDDVRPPIAEQMDGRAGHDELRAELFGLDEGAVREFLPRDSRGKAQVVLDARARSGLSPGRARLDHEHVEPLGGGVHGGREPRRSGSDDDEIVHDILVQSVQAQALSQLIDRRPPQDALPAADDDRDVSEADPESVQRRLDVIVAVEIDVGVRLIVARQELAQPERRRAVLRAEEHDAPLALGHQGRSSQNERAQEDLAQLDVRLDQRADLLRGQLEHARRAARPCAHDDRASRQQIDVPREAARIVDGDHVVLPRQDLDPAFDDDVQRTVAVALNPEALAVGEASLQRERLDPRDLRCRERRKHVLLMGCGGGGAIRGHASTSGGLHV